MPNFKEDENDVEMKDISSNSINQCKDNMIVINNIEENNSNLPLSEKNQTLFNSNIIEDKSIPKQEEIDELIGELVEIENNLNKNSYNM